MDADRNLGRYSGFWIGLCRNLRRTLEHLSASSFIIVYSYSNSQSLRRLSSHYFGRARGLFGLTNARQRWMSSRSRSRKLLYLSRSTSRYPRFLFSFTSMLLLPSDGVPCSLSGRRME